MFESRSDGSRSRVVRINGLEEFRRSVLVSSIQRPVVVMVYSDVGNEIKQMRDVYHGVADLFKTKVRFVSMDLQEKQHDALENYQIIGQLMTMQNITRLGLPIMLFFRHGDLYAPEHEPAIMLQGLHTKEHLAGFVRNKFFHREKPIIEVPFQDLTATPLAQKSSGPRNCGNGDDKKSEEKLSLMQRFLNLFKRK